MKAKLTLCFNYIDIYAKTFILYPHLYIFNVLIVLEGSFLPFYCDEYPLKIFQLTRLMFYSNHYYCKTQFEVYLNDNCWFIQLNQVPC